VVVLLLFYPLWRCVLVLFCAVARLAVLAYGKTCSYYRKTVVAAGREEYKTGIGRSYYLSHPCFSRLTTGTITPKYDARVRTAQCVPRGVAAARRVKGDGAEDNGRVLLQLETVATDLAVHICCACRCFCLGLRVSSPRQYLEIVGIRPDRA
jgi:hypothetical protein